MADGGSVRAGGDGGRSGRAGRLRGAMPLRRWYGLSWRSVGLFVALTMGGLAVLFHYDRAVYLAVEGWDSSQYDWDRAFRVMGWVPLWLAAAAALALHDSQYRRQLGWMVFSRFLLLAVPVLATAGLSELLKVVVRRLRPVDSGGWMAWRGWDQATWHTGGLSMPSGHAAVAFAACFMLGYLFPRARLVWWVAALGCAATRVLSGAHFVSDVFVSAMLAWAVARTTWLYHLKISRPWKRRYPDLVVGPAVD